MADRKAPKVKVKLDPESEAWNRLPWRKLEQHVYRIQKRIYRASQRGEKRKVRDGDKIEIDHVDGNHHNENPSNLRALHLHCHDERHAKPPEEWEYAAGVNHK